MKQNRKLRPTLFFLCICLAVLTQSGVLAVSPSPEATAETDMETESAAESAVETDLETLLAQFREEWGLDEDNFAMAYVNLETGEYAVFQYDQWMVAGSVFKVPLAMLYYDKINAGELTAQSTVGGLTLGSALERIIVNSDNDAAKTLMYAIGNNVWSNYRALLTQYSDQDYDSRFYSENVMNCHYMVDCLTYLYENSANYTTLLEDMAAAMPGMYFQKYVTDYTVCHKYGLYEGAVNDVAIVYGPQTYILAAFSQDVWDAETMLGELNQLLCQRLETLMEQAAAEAEAAAQAEEEAAAEEASQTAEEAAAEEEPEISAEILEPPAEESSGTSPETSPEVSAEAAEDQDPLLETETGGQETAAPHSAEAAADDTWSVMAVVIPLAAAGGMAVLVAAGWLLWRRRSRQRKSRTRR